MAVLTQHRAVIMVNRNIDTY